MRTTTPLVLIALVLAVGCARASSGSGQAAGTPEAVARGKAIFAGNCATCHGSSGSEGGIGPSLKNERTRKNLSQTIAWIKNPEPPMPKLFPSPLSDQDVEDVAAYVQSL